MSIKKRGEFYHFRFNVNATTYSGNTGETEQKEALKFERTLKSNLIKLHTVETCYDRFRQSVLGVDPILLEDAWGNFTGKPGIRKTERLKMCESHWKDFVSYMTDNHPKVKSMERVTKRHAEEYIGFTEQRGRWIKNESSGERLSPNTLNDFRKTLKRVFDVLADDAGVHDNPFAGIALLKKRAKSREAFTPEELLIIDEKSKTVPWVRHIFMVGINTGLREGDICCLKWDNVKDGYISLETRKTGKQVEIPILPPLEKHLSGLLRIDDYVFPSLADRYLDSKRRSGIGKEVGKFLRTKCKIQTTKAIKGRDRKSVIKDVHSLRHTFVYLAALAGVPLPVVQGVVGHASAEMTKLYMDHAGREEKARLMKQIPHFIGA
jgi:integrase